MKMASVGFSGLIRGFKGISIDSFNVKNLVNCSRFFLSHCHADHMENIKGFISKARDNPDLRLFCTLESSIILRNKFYRPNWKHQDKNALESVIRTLKMGMSYTILVPEHEYETNVTVLPAFHCAGSCMYLFKRNDHRVLYTGDFRFQKHELANIRALHENNGATIALDTVYLDTTFFKQASNHFPSRKAVLKMIIQEIDDFLEKFKTGSVFITRPYYLGSEIIIRALSKKYKCPVHVEWHAYKLYKGIREVFPFITTNARNTFIHLRTRYANGKQTIEGQNALQVHASAMWYARNGKSRKWIQRDDQGRVKIAHSTHSSRSELSEFIKYFKPHSAVAISIPSGYSQKEVR
ncbi:protein artemis-like [Neocloeon triangulifer]|uniref:protein artemis-like n=1 Tax=Neocloeon triangulifer TaxID=2078957 RepID=UPI00286ECEDA|nr:protein artemis-like [Neocloeon triangulifer]